jgi:hypothetical protein
MNINWIEHSQKTLAHLKDIKDKRNQDRLDLVRGMRFAFGALGQSLSG